MSTKKLKPDWQSFQRELDQGRFESALVLIDHLDEKNANNNLKTIKLKVQRLKIYNRMQWLPEADLVAAELLNDLKERPTVFDKDSKEELYLELALFYVLSGHLAAAENYFKQLIKTKSGALYYSELAILYEQQGEKEKALTIYNKLLSRAFEKKKLDAATGRVIGRTAGLREFGSDELAMLEYFIEKYRGEPLECRLSFSLARIFSRLEKNEQELSLLEEANKLNALEQKKSGVIKTVKDTRAQKLALQRIFPEPSPSWMPEYYRSSRPYIFILGMPRSGTTLLEQILGAHSTVGNTGESRALGVAIKRCLKDRAPLPEDIGSTEPFIRFKTLDKSDSESIVKYYEKYQALFSNSECLTDKELSHIDRVGLIANMFPLAKFVSIRRNPLDVCASILQHDFSQSHFSNSSLSCAGEYVEYYEKAQHWEKVYPERFFSLEYEGLVADFGSLARKLIGFLDLEWENDIEHFYTRSNSVRTPSLSQVRSKINDSAVGKWRRYRRLLEPAIAYLSELGYLSSGEVERADSSDASE